MCALMVLPSGRSRPGGIIIFIVCDQYKLYCVDCLLNAGNFRGPGLPPLALHDQKFSAVKLSLGL